ncbi:MAG: Zn-dependent dipeptidase, microsomal dipeptidase-like protein [Clostridia bacterium 41_269]|nr:MAG: Zn-dependent dipeptidase, microsomal dipeptidase-like protein [Clostridia bacterium 41_269]
MLLRSKDIIIADAHCDTILEINKGKKIGIRSDKGHVDIPRMIEGNINIQFFAVFVEPQFKPHCALERTLHLIDDFFKEIEENKAKIEIVINFCNIDRILKNNRIAALLCIEGGEAIQEDLSLLRIFYRLGVRCLTLTWNQRNAIGDGINEKPVGGLSNFGIEVIKEMNNLGMLIDVSHLNQGGFWDVIRYSEYPVIASHSNVYEICNHPRNINQKQIKALAEKDGVICITFVPFLLRKCFDTAEAEDVVTHIKYIKKLVGVDYIGIGSDFDGTESMPKGLEHVGKMPFLIELLSKNGFKDSEIEKIMGGNIIRLLKRVLKG